MRHVTRALVLLVIAAVPAYAGVLVQGTVAPEPSTIGLVATGIGFLGGVAWWRSRKK
ncbi:MAG TPA: PEP-CTERM sorting domain-containing protein [Gemmatimonadaceae bacterium]|nr:PEP-CTERM sorting domain-containing protein [Gemmatimonadaceae bacterium]